MKPPVVEVSNGRLSGARHNGYFSFLGVPYAAPPVGEFRFALPSAHDSWAGLREASTHGPTAPQILEPFDAFDSFPLAGSGWERGDDFLTANIWVPENCGVPLPVMVFIHGGSWLTGSNNVLACDGAGFARSGVVCISLNYRLGVEGFLPIPGVPTNLGLRDLLFALHWIQKNVSAFGGDPGNVTVFGQSAGAMSIGALMSSPLAVGLFRRAILQSGHGSMVRPISVARRVVSVLAEELGISAHKEGFRSRSADECVEGLDRVMRIQSDIDLCDADGVDPIYGLSPVSPVFGDDVLPRIPLAGLVEGMGREVDLLIGTDREEMNLYYVPTGVRNSIKQEEVHYILRRSRPNAGSVLSAYGLGRAGASPGNIFTQAMTDLVFRSPSRLFALAHRGASHVYEFAWRSPACQGELGACHAIELPFVFNTLACCSGPQGFLGDHPPQALANTAHLLWDKFARDGQLPWPEYNRTTREVFQLERGESISEPPTAAEQYIGP